MQLCASELQQKHVNWRLDWSRWFLTSTFRIVSPHRRCSVVSFPQLRNMQPKTRRYNPGDSFALTFPGLRPLPTKINVRFVSLTTLTGADFEWLREDAEAPPSHNESVQELYGFDTEFDDLRICLIQIATRSRSLLISVPNSVRRPEPHDSSKRWRSWRHQCAAAKHGIDVLRHWLSNPTKGKVGAEIWQDALWIYKDLGIGMDGGYDLTESGRQSYLKAPKQGLFNMFKDVHPHCEGTKDKNMTRQMGH